MLPDRLERTPGVRCAKVNPIARHPAARLPFTPAIMGGKTLTRRFDRRVSRAKAAIQILAQPCADCADASQIFDERRRLRHAGLCRYGTTAVRLKSLGCGQPMAGIGNLHAAQWAAGFTWGKDRQPAASGNQVATKPTFETHKAKRASPCES